MESSLRLNVRRGGSGNINCYMFFVADALMEVMNTSLK